MKTMAKLSKFRCFVTIKNGKLMVCDIIDKGQRRGSPEKRGYKIAWKPNENTSPEFLAAVKKIFPDMKWEN